MGGPFTRVEFSSKISCFGGPRASFMQAQLWDRTVGFDGIVHATGPARFDVGNATSAGSIDLYDIDYHPAAQWVEQVLVLELVGPPGWLWGPCNPPPEWRLLWCNGVGTPNMSAGVGFFPLATGLSADAFSCVLTPVVLGDPPVGTATVAASHASIHCSEKADVTLKLKLFRMTNGLEGWILVREGPEITIIGQPRRQVFQQFLEETCSGDAEWKIEVKGKGVYHGFFSDKTWERTSEARNFIDC